MKKNQSLEAELETMRTELKRARSKIKEEVLQKDKRYIRVQNFKPFIPSFAIDALTGIRNYHNDTYVNPFREQKMLEIVDYVNEKCETGNNHIYEEIVEPRAGLPFTEINFLELQEALVRFLIK